MQPPTPAGTACHFKLTQQQPALFGFSRGSFTARSLVGYIGASGLLRPENCTPENEEAAWEFYRCDPNFRFPAGDPDPFTRCDVQ